MREDVLSRRRVFLDDRLQEQFVEDGFVILEPFRPAVLDKIKGLFQSVPSGIVKGFYASAFSSDVHYRQTVNEEIQNILGDFCAKFFCSYQPLVASFVVKNPGRESNLPVHQDWTLVDESRFTSLSVWIPVTPLTSENGPLYVLRGSHRTIPGFRPAPFMSPPYAGFERLLVQKYLEPVILKPGQVIIHDHALLHCSPANITDRPRIAAALTLIPMESTPIHLVRNPDGSIDCYDVDRSFFTDYQFGFLRDPQLQHKPDYPVLWHLAQYKPPVWTLEQSISKKTNGLWKRLLQAATRLVDSIHSSQQFGLLSPGGVWVSSNRPIP